MLIYKVSKKKKERKKSLCALEFFEMCHTARDCGTVCSPSQNGSREKDARISVNFSSSIFFYFRLFTTDICSLTWRRPENWSEWQSKSWQNWLQWRNFFLFILSITCSHTFPSNNRNIFFLSFLFLYILFRKKLLSSNLWLTRDSFHREIKEKTNFSFFSFSHFGLCIRSCTL